MNDSENTASSVESKIDKVLAKDNMFFRSILMISATGVVFSLVGGVAGWLLAAATPAYFRRVYDAMDSEVVQIGIGIGVTRGLAAGLIVGGASLFATAWYRSRVKAGIMQQYQQGSLDDKVN